MFAIRLHGRGGQGIKTAGRMLGCAFFLEGFEVQDSPRYGAERRGAPMSAYVRADRAPINARGIIAQPGLVIVADDTLVPVPAAGVLLGMTERTVFLLASREPDAVWRSRLNLQGPILIIPPLDITPAESALIGAACVGAAACLTGVIGREALSAAIREELGKLGAELVAKNIEIALRNYELMLDAKGIVQASAAVPLENYQQPAWIDLPLEPPGWASPTIAAAQTGTLVKTGLWRTQCPVIDYASCHQCCWVCGGFCPDSAISIGNDGFPMIDYEHCKGCLICVAQCPAHAIAAIPEAEAQHRRERQGATP